MDKVENLAAIVRREMIDYLGPALNGTLYFTENTDQQVYAILSVPHTPARPYIVMLVRILNERIVIETDITSKPLYEELRRAGIPDEQISPASRR